MQAVRTTLLLTMAAMAASAQKPGPATDAPYVPQPILQGGVVLTLFPPGSPYLKADKIREPEQYSVSQYVPGGSIASSTFTIPPSKSIRSIAESIPVRRSSSRREAVTTR